jgi:uncharacterized protein (TIGR01244 family)
MRYSIPFFIALVIVTFVFASNTDPLPNLQMPRYGVFTAGQPSVEGFKIAEQTGIRTVMNVLPTKDCLMNEEPLVESNGMTYVHFPFETTGFQEKTFRQFADLMSKVRKPVLIHCSTGNHVAGLWFGYRVVIEKAPLGMALKEARLIGIKPELEDAMFNWLAMRYTGQEQASRQ